MFDVLSLFKGRQLLGKPRSAAAAGVATAFSLLAVSAALPSAANAETTFLSKFIGSQTTNNYERKAEAVFSFDSVTNDLIITLANTRDHANDTGQAVPEDILTGVFFSLDPVNPVLGGDGSVFLAGGSVIVNDPKKGSIGGVQDVSGEWAFQDRLSNSIEAGNKAEFDKITTGGNRSQYGVSAVGLGVFGPHDRFSTTSVWGIDNVGGLDFGLTGLNYTGGNTGVTKQPLIKNSVQITLKAPTLRNWLTTDFNNIQFQYGTSISEARFGGVKVPPTNITVVPEPGEWATYGIMAGSLGMVVLRARKRRK